MWIIFGNRLVNTDFIEYFQAETLGGEWKVIGYGKKINFLESFGSSEAMAKARVEILRSHLSDVKK